MAENNISAAGRTLASACARFIMEKQYANAMMTGYVAYNVALESGDRGLKFRALGWMRSAMKDILKRSADEAKGVEPEPLSCSFCGESEKNARVVAGPNVFICYGCWEVVSHIFSNGDGRKR